MILISGEIVFHMKNIHIFCSAPEEWALKTLWDYSYDFSISTWSRGSSASELSLDAQSKF